MAAKGTSKYLSQQHEHHIATLFGGKQSPSSGAAEHDQGDVRTDDFLIECKMTGHPGKPPKRLPVFIQQLEKIAEEAWSEGKDPMVALRYYAPDSKLGGANGWVDVVVLLARDAIPHCVDVHYGS